MAGLEMNRTQALPSESSQSMAVKRNLFVCPTWPTMCQALCWPHYLPHYMGQLLASSSQLHGGGRGTWASGRLHISPQPYSKWVAKQGFALRSVCPHQMYALSYHTPQREKGQLRDSDKILRIVEPLPTGTSKKVYQRGCHWAEIWILSPPFTSCVDYGQAIQPKPWLSHL